MFISDPQDALLQAHECGRRLRAEAEAERLRSPSSTRRALAVFLRRAADGLDPAAAFNPARHSEERVT